jgi:hypothetical protein
MNLSVSRRQGMNLANGKSNSLDQIWHCEGGVRRCVNILFVLPAIFEISICRGT